MVSSIVPWLDAQANGIRDAAALVKQIGSHYALARAGVKGRTTTDEAARLLKVSTRTLERWRIRRRIPYVEYPRQGAWAPVRFRRADILEWLKQHVVKQRRNGDQAV